MVDIKKSYAKHLTIIFFDSFVHDEDSSIDHLAAYTTDGERLAQSTPMEHLIQSSFELVVNDNRYMVHPAVVGTVSHFLSIIQLILTEFSVFFSLFKQKSIFRFGKI